MLRKALSSGADGVVADLEDAVPPDGKEAAREVALRVLSEAGGSCARLVRVNAAGTPWAEDDLAAVSALDLDGLVLPKATPEAAAALGPEGPPVVALVETATGLRHTYGLASSPRVAALALGAVDLGVELRLEPRPDGLELLYARSQVVLDSAAAGLRAPFDIVHLELRDGGGLEAEARLARSLGFGGKLCVHPAQVEVVNRVFAPSPEEVEGARAVVAAYEAAVREGRGALALGGAMIDLPVVERARRLLERAERSPG